MKSYFLERCTGGAAKNVNFWKTVKKTFFSIWFLLIHCSYTEEDFYGVVYFWRTDNNRQKKKGQKDKPRSTKHYT
jgi:hypothetical protein